MKCITQFNDPRMAQAFVDYMATCNVWLHIDTGQPWRVLLEDESKTALVENELQRFVRNPFHPRYQLASWQTGNIQRLRYPSGILAVVAERGGPFTFLIAFACIAVFVLMQFIDPSLIMRQLTWPVDTTQYLQIWRWFSHALLHFSLLHIVFNLFWWWYIGGAIEKHLGSGKLIVITLISALLSGWMQAKLSGIWFGGLSGVVYALMGYAWLSGERMPERGIFLERGLMFFAVLWLAVGFFGIPGLSIANAAHLAGMLTGLAMAWVDSRSPSAR